MRAWWAGWCVIFLALCACTPAGATATPVWREDATRFFRDATLHLRWANSMGDWVDADGKPMGAKPFASAVAERGGKPVRVEIDVTALVRAHGADFRINTTGGFAKIASREAAEGVPELRITRGGTTRTLLSVADTEMNVTTYKSLGDRPALGTRYGALMRFDQPADSGVTRAVLVLTALKRFEGAPRFLIFQPVAAGVAATVAPGATYEKLRPLTLRVNPRTAGTLGRGTAIAPSSGSGARVLFAIDGAQLKGRPNTRTVGNAIEAWFEGDEKTALSDVIPLPGAHTEAFLTVVLRLDDNWTAVGGKLPGLSNTGQRAAPCVVRGEPMIPGGWGGRPANACHWSARTAFRGVRDGSTGAGSYAYAISPRDVNGVVDWWSQPLPKGRWVAYVQRVRLNDPGRANGEIAYWLVDRATAPGGKQVESALGFIWRDSDQPASAINELWVNVFCGGHDCGPAPWPRSTLRIRRLTVTDGLPDLRAVQTELDALNAAR